MKRLLVIYVLDHPRFSFIDDYCDVLERVLPDDVDLEIIDAIEHDVLGSLDPEDYLGIVVSGSFTKYSTDVGWLHDLRAFIERVRVHGTVPLLGVCMAHELIADMYGGEVKLNPHGSEIGTVELRLTKQGRRSPLFAGFTPAFHLQAAHRHDVLRAPPDAEVLAANERSPCQALRLENLYGVQSHLDISAETLRRYLRTEGGAQTLTALGRIATPEQLEDFLASEIRETDDRERCFANFVAICVAARKARDQQGGDEGAVRPVGDEGAMRAAGAAAHAPDRR